MHTTPSYICHICSSSSILRKRRESWRNCWLSDSSGVKALCSNTAPLLHHWSITSAVGNTMFLLLCVLFYLSFHIVGQWSCLEILGLRIDILCSHFFTLIFFIVLSDNNAYVMDELYDAPNAVKLLFSFCFYVIDYSS